MNVGERIHSVRTLGIITLAAIAVAPYYIEQTTPRFDDPTVVDVALAGLDVVVGIGPWLVDNPLRLVAVVPALLLVLYRGVRRPPVY